MRATGGQALCGKDVTRPVWWIARTTCCIATATSNSIQSAHASPTIPQTILGLAALPILGNDRPRNSANTPRGSAWAPPDANGEPPGNKFSMRPSHPNKKPLASSNASDCRVPCCYQIDIILAGSRHIASPRLHSNAFENAGMLDGLAMARNCDGAWLLVAISIF